MLRQWKGKYRGQPAHICGWTLCGWLQRSFQWHAILRRN
jgi:hypothetical protein